MTSRRGGSYGAGVPRPRRTNATKHQRMMPTPIASGTSPASRHFPNSIRGPIPVATSAPGTHTRTVAGISNVNNAVRSQSKSTSDDSFILCESPGSGLALMDAQHLQARIRFSITLAPSARKALLGLYHAKKRRGEEELVMVECFC